MVLNIFDGLLNNISNIFGGLLEGAKGVLKILTSIKDIIFLLIEVIPIQFKIILISIITISFGIIYYKLGRKG